MRRTSGGPRRPSLAGLWRNERFYHRDIESSVLMAARHGVETFDALLRLLPGVYPSHVADAVRSLRVLKKIPRRMLPSFRPPNISASDSA